MNTYRHRWTQLSLKISPKIILITIITLIVIGGFLWIQWTGGTSITLSNTITIPANTTLGNLPKALNISVGNLRYKLWRKLIAPKISLKQGTFVVPEWTDTLRELFETLENPTETETEITILPGWHRGEISVAFEKAGITGNLLEQESQLIADLQGKYPFLVGKTSLEGFIMPDTYSITGGEDLEVAITRFLNNFEKKIYTPYLSTGKPVGSFYDVLILASIVQEEENSNSQVPIVADILKKRLRQGWAIGADITVCYPELIPGKECQSYVNQYYASGSGNNPYDTRFKTGLPPTPIASVSAPTFFATLDAPATTEAWYYLHDTSGVLHTAVSNAQHEANKAQYLR